MRKNLLAAITLVCLLSYPAEACARLRHRATARPSTSTADTRANRKLSFEIYRDKAKEYRWRLKAGNGRIIADSGEGYHNRADALHGVELVRHAADALLKQK